MDQISLTSTGWQPFSVKTIYSIHEFVSFLGQAQQCQWYQLYDDITGSICRSDKVAGTFEEVRHDDKGKFSYFNDHS